MSPIGQNNCRRTPSSTIIEKVTLDNLKAYRLNPSYAWKGKISEFQKDEKERKKRAASEAKIIQLKPTTVENENTD